MWQRVTGALAVCALAGCSLIFPFDVEQDVDGARLDLGSREAGADGPPIDNDGPHQDVSKPPDGQLLSDGNIKPSCLKVCPGWCSAQTSAPVTAKLNAVWGSSENDLWAVGDLGTVLKYNPSNCKWEPAILNGLNSAMQAAVLGVDLYGVWGESGAVYAVGSAETILRRSGSTWTLDLYTKPDPKAPPPTLLAVGGGSGNQIVAVGTGGMVWGLVGKSWAKWSSNSTKALSGVSSPTSSTPGLGSPGAIYVVGSGGALLYHDDATTKELKLMPASGCLYGHDWQGVWAAPSPPASPAPELVAVAATGEVLRYHSTAGKCTLDKTLKKALVAGQTVRALGGVVATDLWAVGTLGFVGRKTAAGSWGKAQQSKTAVTLHGVTVLQQPRWVVAVGDAGTIIRTTY
jgi:hypothetical protein